MAQAGMPTAAPEQRKTRPVDHHFHFQILFQNFIADFRSISIGLIVASCCLNANVAHMYTLECKHVCFCRFIRMRAKSQIDAVYDRSCRL
jgi:hypothetical protein